MTIETRANPDGTYRAIIHFEPTGFQYQVLGYSETPRTVLGSYPTPESAHQAAVDYLAIADAEKVSTLADIDRAAIRPPRS